MGKLTLLRLCGWHDYIARDDETRNWL